MPPINADPRFAWTIARRWFSQYLRLRHGYAYLLGAQAPTPRARLISSALRVSSMMYMFSRVLGVPFREGPALLTGLSAALFDDLLDQRREPAAVLGRILIDGDVGVCSSAESSYLEVVHRALRAELGQRERVELRRHLAALLDAEEISLVGGDPQWAARGYLALRVFLTVLGVREDELDEDVGLAYGEYLQILDDYEDVEGDRPELSYFTAHPGFDVDGHYVERIRPLLPRLFRRRCDVAELLGFSDTYHSYHVALYRDRHPRPGGDTVKMRVIRGVVRGSAPFVPFSTPPEP